MRQRDEVEREYEQVIAIAAGQGENDEAQDLAIGLRKLYKVPPGD